MTVSDQIIQVINVLCEKFGIAIDWTGKNVIPYIETLCAKLVTYEIATSIVWMVFMVFLSIASIVATNKLIPICKKGLEESYKEDILMSMIFGIAGLIILNVATIIVVGCQIMDIVECMTFPEMYIFEYVSALVNAA